MPPEKSQSEPVSRVEECDPKDAGLAGDYLRWISFQGFCSLSTEPPGKLKPPIKPEAERVRAIQATLKAPQGRE